MKHTVLLVLILWASAYASQRVVVAEEFTATWCTYCPGAARGLDEVYERGFDSLAVIAYHSSTSDPFYTAEAASRFSYYSISGYPTSYFDGILNEVGGLHYGTMYPFFRHHVTNRLSVSSSLEITLVCSYDSVVNSGTVTATILNTSGGTVNGNLHFVIVENNIPYNWQGMTELDFVMRDMLPNASGEAVSISPSDTIIRSRLFNTTASWDEDNCHIVVFVQAASRLIYQGAEIALIPEPAMEFYRVMPHEVSGNGNGIIEPGESMGAVVYGKNAGSGVFNGTAAIQCADPNISITGSAPASVSMAPGDVDTVITFTCTVSPSCPNPHLATFSLNFSSETDDFPFNVTTQPGFSDDIESGQGGWTHSGIRDNWHITTHKSNSSTHSWYSGVEGSWQYTDENDASLVSPYFTATPDSFLYFYHQYSLESGWDYGYIEVDNGSELWRTLAEINGTQSSWTQTSYLLSDFNGQTIRLRYRFVSDGGVHQEGWYVDDVLVPTFIGVEEHKIDEAAGMTMLRVYPNPFTNTIKIYYQFEHDESLAEQASMYIYDASGRLVKVLQPSAADVRMVTWKGTDQQGLVLPAGVYFVKLLVDHCVVVEKIILTR